MKDTLVEKIVIRIVIVLLFWPMAFIWFLLLVFHGHKLFGLVLKRTGENLFKNL